MAMQLEEWVGVFRVGSGGRHEEKMRMLLLKIDGNVSCCGGR